MDRKPLPRFFTLDKKNEKIIASPVFFTFERNIQAVTLTDRGMGFLSFLLDVERNCSGDMFPHTEALSRTEYPATVDEAETPLSATEKLFRCFDGIAEDLCSWCLENSKKPFDFFVAHVLDALEHPEQTDDEWELCGEYHQMMPWSDSLYYSDLTLAGTPEWYLTDSALAEFEKRGSPSRVRKMEVARRVRKFIEERNVSDTIHRLHEHDADTFLPAYLRERPGAIPQPRDDAPPIMTRKRKALASEASASANRRKTRFSARRSEMRSSGQTPIF